MTGQFRGGGMILTVTAMSHPISALRMIFHEDVSISVFLSVNDIIWLTWRGSYNNDFSMRATKGLTWATRIDIVLVLLLPN